MYCSVLFLFVSTLCFELYDIRFVITFINAICGVMNYSLLRLHLVAFYAKLNKYK